MSQPLATAGGQKNAFTLLMRSSSRGSSGKVGKEQERAQHTQQAKRQRTSSGALPAVASSSHQDHATACQATASTSHKGYCNGSQAEEANSMQLPAAQQVEQQEQAWAQQGPHQQHQQQQVQQQQQQQQAAVEAFRRAFSGSGGTGVRPQPFRHYLVLDLEATSNRARNLNPVEIIEVSCIVLEVTEQGQCSLQQEFSSFVRPDQHPRLDPFVTEFNGITQQQVDAAPPLREVLSSLDSWLQAQGLLEEGASFAPVTWTSWDLKIAVETECKWRGIERPWYLRRWVDLKRHYLNKYKKAGNLKSCVEAAGLEWLGHAHSGIDDARNTARLAIKLLQQGARLTITEQFEEPAAAGSSKGAAAAPTSRSTNAGAGALKGPGSGSAAGGSMRQALLAPKKAAPHPVDAQGRWNGQCKCGIKAAPRVTKKPGPNHGRSFFSCGNWRITKQGQACDFFLWEDQQEQGAAM